MKKLLALVLALVMSMSLVTISNAAFKDADKIDYDEAVEVMNAVGVLVGDEKGNFNAKDNLTRAQAAKIISYLLLGNKTAEALAGSGKFTDVAKTSWFAGFVDYCASTGVVNGVGDGKFDPNGQLTGYQFAKMLLVALGYDAKIEGFTGADWQINVSKRADQADLFDNLDISGNAALTREQAAQMCLNTLKSPLVEYSNKGGNLTINGATINIGASNAEYKTSSTKIADQTIYANKLNSSAGEYIVEFAEQYYPKLVLSEKFDDFERPCYTWSYDKKDLGTFAMKDMLEKTFVGEVTGKDLYDLLGKTVVEDYKTFVAIDGVEDKAVNAKIFTAAAMNKNNKTAVGGTGDGVVTEVYVNNDAKEVYIVIINEYLAIAAKDYDTKKETVKFNVYGIDAVSKEYVKKTDGAKNVEDMTVSSDDFALVADAKENDAYVVTVAKGEIQTVVKADIVEDTAITSFKLGSNVKADGTTYKYSSAAEYDVEVLDNYTGISANGVNLKDITYNIYLDTHGNLLGVDKVTAADNYVFIAGVDSKASNLSAKNYDASAIFTDGTMKTITFKADKSSPITGALANTWCTYTVDKDGVYTLTEVKDTINEAKNIKVAQKHDADFSDDIDKKHIALEGGTGYAGVYGNDNTVYLLAELKSIKTTAGAKDYTAIISGVQSVTTGVKNASLTGWNLAEAKANTKVDKQEPTTAASGVYTLYKSNGYVIAAVVVGEDNEASKNLVYVSSSSVNYEAYDKTNDEWTWTREVIIDGEKAELTEVGDSLTYLGNMLKGEWYQVKYNAKGEVIGVLDGDTTSEYKNNYKDWSLEDGKDYETDITELYNTIKNGKDSILYTESFTDKTPTMKGSTLYVNKAVSEGFYVDENAKVVFIQTNDGKETTEYETGSDEVQSFIESLNKNKNGSYDYTISAILQNGAAKVVIIKDDADSTVNKGDVESSAIKGVDLRTPAAVKVRYYGELPKIDATLNAIEKAILENGDVTIIDKTKTGTVYAWTVQDSHGFEATYKFKAEAGSFVEVFKVADVTWSSTKSKATTTGAGYYTNDDEITVVLTSDAGFAKNSYTATVTGISGTATATVSSDKKTVTVKISSISGLTADVDSWSIALS